MAATTESLLITQFILYMQNKSIWPCHLFIGDDPQKLTSDESIELRDDFINKLYPKPSKG